MAPCEGLVTESHETKRGRTHDLNGNLSGIPSGQFKNHPTGIDDKFKASFKWLAGKRIDDDVGPYWRIHNKLYDLTDFVDRHPGGRDWILTTKGTDITEAFESSHINLTAEKTLPKYYVKDINTPRNSPYTFHEDGFYKTLKRKIRPVLEKVGRGPTLKMLLMQDCLMLSFLTLAIIGTITYSYTMVIISGILLAMNMMCAHNFFHQRDNFRMYYFDFSMLSSYDWRISHGLSHHLFTNTKYDIELTALEPYFVFMPIAGKTFMQRYGVRVYEFLLIPPAFIIQYLSKLYYVLSGSYRLRPENLLPLAELLVMCTIAPSIGAGFKLWMALHGASSTWFSGIGLMVAHHHPNIYHQGDKFRDQPDWGLCQLDAVRDRVEVKGNLFLVSTTFGDHSLHHLFPTVDHSKLDALYPTFFETCKEFNIPFEFLSHWELALGMYQQLANNTPNTSSPGYKTKSE